MTTTAHIFDIPFGYTVRGVRARCRQVDDHVVTDTVPTEIPALSSADAPVAFRTYKRQDNSTVFELRAHERRALHAVRGPDGEDLDPDGLRRVLARMNTTSVTWRECPFDVPLGYIGKVRIDDLRRGPKDFRTIEVDGLDAARDRAASAAGRMAFVDGVLHAVPPEPRWAVQTSIGAEPVVIRVDLEDMRAEPFRIERRKDMLRFARFAKQDIRMLHDLEDHGLIDWSLDDVGLSVRKTAGFVADLVRGTSGESLMHMPAAFFPLLVDLREVVSSQSRDIRHVATLLSDIHASLATRSTEADGICRTIRAYSRLQIQRYRDIEGLLASPSQEAEALKDLVL